VWVGYDGLDEAGAVGTTRSLSSSTDEGTRAASNFGREIEVAACTGRANEVIPRASLIVKSLISAKFCGGSRVSTPLDGHQYFDSSRNVGVAAG
jgi:hypothetical protein